MTQRLNMESPINQKAKAEAIAQMTPTQRMTGLAPVQLTSEEGGTCTFNLCLLGRDPSADEIAAVKRLIPYAERKGFVRDLLLNGYNSTYKADIARVMRYAAGESASSTYVEDLLVLLGCMARGVETHELIGESVVDNLIDLKSKCERQTT